MGNKGILVVIVLVAGAAIFWLLGGADLFTSSGGADNDAADGDGAGLLEHGVADGGAGSGDVAPAQGPVLFGRAKAQRVGVGGLMGRVVDFGSGDAVEGARVVLTGTGYGDEAVSHRLTTDAHGRFHFERIVAGEGYALHVVGGAHQRTLAGVAVDADALRDLGTIWLGESGVLAGVVVDAEGQGLVGARVGVHRGGSLLDMLQHLPDLMEKLDQDPVPLAKGESGAGGRFRIEGVDPGPLIVVVRAAGHRQMMVKAVMTADGAAGGALRIVLGPSGPLAGVVVDEHGRAVPGARVACMDQNDMDAAFFGRQFAQTDAEGRFRIDSPPTLANVTVVVAAEGYPTLFRKVAAGSDDLRLVLRGGVEVVLRILETGTERAIEGARVMAMFGDEARPANDKLGFAHGVTDDRGEAFLAGRPGVLQMFFLSHPDRGLGIYAPWMPGGQSIVKGPADTAVKAPRTTLVFHLDVGITIRGRVADPDGNPVAGANLRVIGAMGFGGTTTTGDDGSYEMRGQSAAVQMIVARAPGYVQEMSGQAGVPTPKPDGRGGFALDIVMLPAATVTGRVLGPDGKPLAGARAKRGVAPGELVLPVGLGAVAEGVTNAAGRYVLDGVRPGDEVRMLAHHGEYVDGRCAAFAVRAGAVNDAPDISLKHGSKLTVLVVGPSGRAVSKARVEASVRPHEEDKVQWDPLSQWRNFADLVTPADGTVALERLPRGTVTVTATHDDFAGVRRTVPVERLDGGKPSATDLRLELREPYTLRGRVVDEAGAPVAGADLATAAGAGGPADAWVPTRTGTSGADGRFEIDGLPDEGLTLLAMADGYRKTQIQVATPRAEVEIPLRRVSADAQKRLAEVQKELMEVYQAFQSVKDDAERQSLLQRMRALQAEQAKLQGDGNR